MLLDPLLDIRENKGTTFTSLVSDVMTCITTF